MERKSKFAQAFSLLTIITTGAVYPQSNDLDTLFYFNHDSLNLSPIFTGDVLDAAVYFSPKPTWTGYSILELHFLFTPGSGQTGDTLSLSHSGQAGQPGTPFLVLPIDVTGEQERYPNWKKVDLSEFGELENLSGDFWLVGKSLISCTGSESRSQHSFIYSAIGNQWHTSLFDFAVMAIVQHDLPSSIDDEKARVSEITPLQVEIYPIPSITRLLSM